MEYNHQVDSNFISGINELFRSQSINSTALYNVPIPIPSCRFSCFESNLNGEYHLNPEDNDYYRGLIWELWTGDYSLKATQMSVRPKVGQLLSVETSWSSPWGPAPYGGPATVRGDLMILISAETLWEGSNAGTHWGCLSMRSLCAVLPERHLDITVDIIRTSLEVFRSSRREWILENCLEIWNFLLLNRRMCNSISSFTLGKNKFLLSKIYLSPIVQ